MTRRPSSLIRVVWANTFRTALRRFQRATHGSCEKLFCGPSGKRRAAAVESEAGADSGSWDAVVGVGGMERVLKEVGVVK